MLMMKIIIIKKKTILYIVRVKKIKKKVLI